MTNVYYTYAFKWMRTSPDVLLAPSAQLVKCCTASALHLRRNRQRYLACSVRLQALWQSAVSTTAMGCTAPFAVSGHGASCCPAYIVSVDLPLPVMEARGSLLLNGHFGGQCPQGLLLCGVGVVSRAHDQGGPQALLHREAASSSLSDISKQLTRSRPTNGAYQT